MTQNALLRDLRAFLSRRRDRANAVHLVNCGHIDLPDYLLRDVGLWPVAPDRRP